MKVDDEVIEMLPGDLRRIAEVAGLEATVRIARAFRGTYLYVTGLDEITRRARDTMIKRDYDSGTGTSKLARKYGLTNRHIRRILNSPLEEMPEDILSLLCSRE